MSPEIVTTHSRSGHLRECISCGQNLLSEIQFRSSVFTVTSDCRPWTHPLRLAVCDTCGLVQSVIDDSWRTSTREIYRQYDSYFQSSLKDQLTFGQGEIGSRTQMFIEAVLTTVSLPVRSSVLDFGCGSGNVLRTLSSLRDDLILDGYDLDSRVESQLIGIPNFRHLHSDLLPTAEKYDLIVLSHTLEHFESPAKTLQDLSGLLTDSGTLAIAVPDCSADPLKLTVADHCTHFSPAGLTRWLNTQGFLSHELFPGQTSRECLVVATKGGFAQEPDGPLDSSWFQDAANWLATAAAQLKSFNRENPVGVFGTAIAGSWVLAQEPELVDCFVDEDPSRSHEFHSRPVFDLDSIPTNRSIIVPFFGDYEKKLLSRLRSRRPDVRWVGLDELVQSRDRANKVVS